MKKNNKKKKRKLSLVGQYKKGIRNGRTRSAWAKYIREKGLNRSQMRKHYADPNSDVLPLINLRNGKMRCKNAGGWVDETPEDFEKQLEIYRECHRMNLRDGKRKWAVDHIWEVCDKGPHCSSNLQILSLEDHIQKTKTEQKKRKIKENFNEHL